MKPIIVVIPFVVLAVYIGQGLESDTAALAMGGILGLMAGALAALIYAIARDVRADRERAAAQRRPLSATVLDAEWRDAPAERRGPARGPVVVEGEWREVGEQRPAIRGQVEAPERALVRTGSSRPSTN